MSISDAVAPHIPFLRRFARALCGTQAAGDAYVAAALEAILADPGCFDSELEPKVALYKLFLRNWRNVPLNKHVDSSIFGDEAGAGRNLGGHLARAAHRISLGFSGVVQLEGNRANP